MKSKIFVVGFDSLVDHMFRKEGWEVVDEINDADLVVFTGGSDISPEIYNAENLGRSYTNPRRDEQEIAVFNTASEMGKAMAGICRGGQLLNCLMGGAMHQHVDGHGGTHVMTILDTGQEVRTTSTHHQMMIPAPHGKVHAVAKLGKPKYMDGLRDEHKAMIPDYDTEVVSYKTIGGAPVLCFQGHPEYGHQETTDVFFQILQTLLEEKVVN